MSEAETKRKRFSEIKEKTSLGCQKANLQNVLSVLTHYSLIQHIHILSIEKKQNQTKSLLLLLLLSCTKSSRRRRDWVVKAGVGWVAREKESMKSFFFLWALHQLVVVLYQN